MEYINLCAAVLLFLIGVAHSVVGEIMIIRHLFQLDLFPDLRFDLFAKRTLRFAWHLTTIAWWGIAGIVFLQFRYSSGRFSIQTVLAVTFFISFLMVLIGTRGRHLSWSTFLIVAILFWVTGF